MADRSSRQGSSSISTLFLLYFLQGLPYGFQVNLLPLLLRQNQFSLTRIGFTRMLSLPWILKFTVAPFVDKSAFLHRWIGASLAGMSALYLFSAVAGSSDVLTLLCCVFGLNVLSATQDVAVDALAIQLLKCGELGTGNTAQVVGYKFGALFGGGVFAWLAAFISWDALLGSMGCFYLVLSFTLLSHLQNIQSGNSNCCFISEPTTEIHSCSNKTENQDEPGMPRMAHVQQEKYHVQSKQAEYRACKRGQSKHPMALPLSNEKSTSRVGFLDVFNSVLHSPGFVWLVMYVLVYKLGEQGAASMFPLFLLDQGLPKEVVGFVSGVCGQVFSISGSTFGGWLIGQHSSNRAWLIKILLWTSLPRSLLLLAQWAQVSNWTAVSLFQATLFDSILQFTAGVVTTATFTLMMGVSQEATTGSQATHFSILATAEVIGKLFMISLSGILVDWMGYCAFFGFCAALAVAVTAVLYQAPTSILTHVNKSE